MIAIEIGMAIAVIAGVTVGAFIGSVTSSRALGVVVAFALVPTLAFVPVAVGAIAGAEGGRPTPLVSHTQLEADRAMTQQMTVAFGPGMDAMMTTNGMLERSASSAYVVALEQHVADFDRMAAPTP